LLAILGWFLLSAGANRAAAIGWDPDDFIITGGPAGTQSMGPAKVAPNRNYFLTMRRPRELPSPFPSIEERERVEETLPVSLRSGA
jgi:hypothetical protein